MSSVQPVQLVERGAENAAEDGINHRTFSMSFKDVGVERKFQREEHERSLKNGTIHVFFVVLLVCIVIGAAFFFMPDLFDAGDEAKTFCQIFSIYFVLGGANISIAICLRKAKGDGWLLNRPHIMTQLRFQFELISPTVMVLLQLSSFVQSCTSNDCEDFVTIPLQNNNSSMLIGTLMQHAVNNNALKWLWIGIIGLFVLVPSAIGANYSIFFTFSVWLINAIPLLVIGIIRCEHWLDYLLVIFFIMVSLFNINIIRIYEKTRRENYLFIRNNEIKLRKQSITIRETQCEVDAIKEKLSVAQEKLAAARALVQQVMKEGGSALALHELPHSDLDFGEGERKSLGEGSFGTVFRGTLRGRIEVAVKTIRVNKITEQVLSKFRAEILIMAPLRHENLVRLYGGVWNEGADKLCIVLEFCPHGSLTAFLLSGMAQGDWKGLYFGLALGGAKGLAYLHHDLREPIIHRDIKPDNILVGEKVVAKLADFGESRNFEQSSGNDKNDALTMTMVGTKLFCAPEVTAGGRYNESADTFSFALVLLCLAAGNITYLQQQHRPGSRFLKYETGQRPPIPSTVLENIPEVARLIQDMWQGDFRLRPTMQNVVNTLLNLAPDDYMEEGSGDLNKSSSIKIMNDNILTAAQNLHRQSSKTYAAFLSHHKVACATEARLVKDKYEALVDVECFLDSDNLRDLRWLIDHVKDSDVLIILQSKEVLHRPWCLIELNAAIEHGVPIVALNCQGKGYDFVEAVDFMLHLETALATLNPGALEILKKNEIDPLRLAYKLSSVLPNIISIPLNTSASDNAIRATMLDLVAAATSTKPRSIVEDFDEWLKNRKSKEKLELEQLLDQGTIRGTQRGRMLAKVERADEMADELLREREMVAKLMAKNDKLEAKVERLEAKLGY